MARSLPIKFSGPVSFGDNMRNQKGFTLIELLLVLAIIGIISAIAIPALLGQRESARQKATESAAGAIKSELAVWAEQVRKTGTAPTASAAVAAVLAMPQYTYPSVKNAYSPGVGPYAASAVTANGAVGLLAGSTTGADTSAYQTVTVNFVHAGGAGSALVAIDQ